MPTIEFSSVLPGDFRVDLEALLFFNPLQGRARLAIAESIERYGEPRVTVADGHLRVTVGSLDDVQTLYALARDEDTCELAGVAVYTRDRDRLLILHLAVTEPFAVPRRADHGLLAVRLALAVRNVARRLQGIRGVLLPYPARA